MFKVYCKLHPVSNKRFPFMGDAVKAVEPWVVLNAASPKAKQYPVVKDINVLPSVSIRSI
jgi:hypothetical protein